VWQHLDIGQPDGAIDGYMKAVVTNASAGIAPIARAAMPHVLDADAA
jgi:hypothetical protein